MLVPEAAMHENRRAVFSQYHIWRTRQLAGVQPVSVTTSPQSLANVQLWLSVSTADVGHYARTLSRKHSVCHGENSNIATGPTLLHDN